MDTDFMSKTHAIQVINDSHLIDCVLKLSDCGFFCHEYTSIEAARYSATEVL